MALDLAATLRNAEQILRDGQVNEAATLYRQAADHLFAEGFYSKAAPLPDLEDLFAELRAEADADPLVDEADAYIALARTGIETGAVELAIEALLHAVRSPRRSGASDAYRCWPSSIAISATSPGRSNGTNEGLKRPPPAQRMGQD